MEISDAQHAAFVLGHGWNLEHYRAPGATRGGRRRALIEPVDPLSLEPGQQVRFLGDRRWWDVRAVSAHHVVLTRTRNFGSEGLSYTIVSWTQGRRGLHSSWGHWPIDTNEQCQAIADAMDAGAGEANAMNGELEFSERRAIRLDIAAVRVPRTAAA